MFKHLVKENKLDKEFKRYFGKNLVKDKHKTFITELIKGPPKTKPKVQEICSIASSFISKNTSNQTHANNNFI